MSILEIVISTKEENLWGKYVQNVGRRTETVQSFA